ncbi:MAG: putative glycosyl transferase [Bacteroidetes bacterium]|nr:putative glycosyl transferase [Bacteroidota bacterium]
MSSLVSICIPTYNGEQYLKECLDTVLAQTYTNLEIIVVDDCSKDATAAIIEEYIRKDKRIKLYRNPENLGLVGNWNKCLELAQGEWIKFIFQDDLVKPDCIEKQINGANGHSFVVCDREFIFDDKVPEAIKAYYNGPLLALKKMISTGKNIFITAAEISNYAAANISLNFIGEPTAVLFKKEAVKKYGIFNADLSQICDLEYWLRIATAEGLVYIPEELVSFRIHASSTTSQNVISNTKFKPRYIDVILLAHEFLHGNEFETFRNSISFSQKKKIGFFITSRMIEAKKAFEKDPSFDPQFFNNLFVKYPALKPYYRPSFAAKLVYCTVMLRRKLRKL